MPENASFPTSQESKALSPYAEKCSPIRAIAMVAKTLPENGRGKLVTPRFHGKLIYPDDETKYFIRHVDRRNREKRERKIGSIAREIVRTKKTESGLGNLIADVMRKVAKTDFALINPGAMRNDLPPGPLSFENLYRAIPNNERIVKMKVTGYELKRILRIAHCGARGFFSTSGLKVRAIDLKYGAPATDLNRDQEISHWEVNRLLDVRDERGRRIQNKKTYTLATTQYLASGGDDLHWATRRIPARRVDHQSVQTPLRDALEEYLQQSGSINTVQQPLVDPSRPRLVLRASKKWRRKSFDWSNKTSKN